MRRDDHDVRAHVIGVIGTMRRSMQVRDPRAGEHESQRWSLGGRTDWLQETGVLRGTRLSRLEIGKDANEGQDSAKAMMRSFARRDSCRDVQLGKLGNAI